MKKDLSKIYNPSDVEDKWYEKWIEEKVFTPSEDSKEESFTLMIPPPNVTGILHLGHVLNNSINDVLVRRARMQGKNTLWVPGTDHASIATEAKVSIYLKVKGIDIKSIPLLYIEATYPTISVVTPPPIAIKQELFLFILF